MVARKELIFKRTIRIEFKNPRIPPTKILITVAGITGTSDFVISIIQIAEATPATEPIDKSISPIRRTKVIPVAATSNAEELVIKERIFCPDKNNGVNEL